MGYACVRACACVCGWIKINEQPEPRDKGFSRTFSLVIPRRLSSSDGFDKDLSTDNIRRERSNG